MKYMGSKNRFAKDILKIMLENRGGKDWIEPFVGGGNIIDKVDGVRYGYDSNKYTIQALISIRDHVGELPKNKEEFTESDYKDLRSSDCYPHKGYAGFGFSYGGKWMGGWCRDSVGKRDYVAESYRNAIRQSPLLQGVFLECSDYRDIEIKNQSVVYCDPPYKGTTSYSTVDFNHNEFYEKCRDWGRQGHTVFVSEYEMPSDFVCVWEKRVNSSLTKDTGGKKAVERLFLLSL